MTETVRDQLFGKAGLMSPSCAVKSFTFDSLKSLDSWEVAQITSPPLMRNIGPNLIKIALGFNNLTGNIPDAIGDHCVNVEWIFLADNPGITGPIPENWSNLRKLRKLHLYKTGISGPIPSSLFMCATELRTVDFHDTQLSGPIPDSIGQATKLQELWLYNTKVSGAIPTSITKLKQLQLLYLHSTGLTVPDGANKMWFRTSEDVINFFALIKK